MRTPAALSDLELETLVSYNPHKTVAFCYPKRDPHAHKIPKTGMTESRVGCLSS